MQRVHKIENGFTVIHLDIGSNESRDSYSQKPASPSDKRVSPIQHFSSIGHFRILGIGLELACNGGSCGGISLERHECNLHLKRLPRISLTCTLVPVQYREYENGLFLCRMHCLRLWNVRSFVTRQFQTSDQALGSLKAWRLKIRHKRNGMFSSLF